MQEKDINLLISLKVKELLQKEGYTVIMTRDIDKGLYTESGTIRKKKIEDLNNRLKMKIDSGCDMFLSIHLNYFPEPKYYGAQVWYGDNEESKKFASVLQQNLREYLDKDNKRMEKPAHNSYKILKNNGKMAAVIAECGFLTNINEEAKLKDDKYQQKIAEAMVNAINIYFGMN
jgi:N-acetylmuramoyl-L-alanine amidase